MSVKKIESSPFFRMLSHLLLVVWIVMLASTSSAGCSIFQNACLKSTPTIQAAIIYSQDAELSLKKVESIVNVASLSPEDKKKFDDALVSAWSALRASQHLLAAARDACNSVDPIVVFHEFIQAWKSVAGLVAVLSPLLAGEGIEPLIVSKSKIQ